MAAITNWLIVMNQQKNIHTQDDLNKFNSGIEILKYTPYVDLALSIICIIGATIGLHTAFIGSALSCLAAVFFISGAALLKSRQTLPMLVKAVNDHWNLKAELAMLRLRRY